MKLLCTLIVALLLSSCVGKYYDARFAPPTTEAIAAGSAGAQARSVVSFVGVRRMDSATKAPPQVEFRMRVENLGSVPCTLEQHSMQLLSGSLEPFGEAQLVSADPPLIATGASATYEVLFPLPAGRHADDVDLRSINLRWSIAFGGEAVTNGFTFERVVPSSYDSTNFSFGLGFSSH